MKRRWKSIQSRLLLLLLLVLVPVVAIQAYMYYGLFQERKAAALQANLELARGVVKTFERFVQEVLHQELSIGLALTSYQKLSPEAQNRILLGNQADNPGIWEIFWANPSGVVLAATGPQFLGMRLGDRDYFGKILAGQDYVISDLLLSRTTAKPSFTISRGIRDEQGVLLGVVITAILPERLEEELGVKRVLGGGFALVDTKGMMVYRYPAIKATWEERNWLKQYPQFADALKGKEVEATVYAPFEGKNRLVGFTPVPSIGWAASAGQRKEEVTGPIWAAIGRSAILFGSVLLAAFLLAIVFSRKIANPVGALRRHALALGAGEEREQVPVQSIAEFKDLADTFNVMTENVRMREAALRESEERFRTLNETSPVGVGVSSADGVLLYANSAYELILGYSRGELLGKKASDLYLNPNDRTSWLRAMKEGGAVRNVEIRLKRKDGIPVWVSINTSDICYGGKQAVMGTIQDITERMRAEETLRKAKDELEERVQERTEELATSHDRLQQLASQLIQAQEKERKRVAVELHDSLLSELAAMKFLFEAKLMLLKKGQLADTNEFNKVLALMQKVIKDARGIMNNLRPSILDEVGLIPTIDWHFREYQKVYDHIQIRKQVEVLEKDIPEFLKIVIFRVLQEALNNFAKHGKGDFVDLSLWKSGNALHLRIQDNGQGFDMGGVQKGLGLESMRERVEVSLGSFHIESSEGKGTTIQASWHLPENR